ncbi:PCC domain-containing protein [Chryseobacterium populi]|uniref:Putative DNA-binding protein with PD1-like DNA-binding motif n=1 Tax=Chryseobacterium populi TaxID=1144316 RepID=J2TCH3_9FLAO|nr:PPC domain-containing DNA-binding protein [Chryseobacterium populi]EJL75907.1 putative DNA-binding protein with PD1-like DNA-binding motif [Chryseobacterium populi]
MNSRTVKGNLWIARKIENAYILSLEDRASMIDTLTDFMLNQKIRAGKISGVGILDNAILRFFDPLLKKYWYGELADFIEVYDISGIIYEFEGKTLLALEIRLESENHTVLSGHLMDATVSGKAEFLFYPSENNNSPSKNKVKKPDLTDLNYWSRN